jgi:hypothetical protein
MNNSGMAGLPQAMNTIEDKASVLKTADTARKLETMALFMTPEDMPADPAQNEDLAAIQALIYDDQTPEEIAENFKVRGFSFPLRAAGFSLAALETESQLSGDFDCHHVI